MSISLKIRILLVQVWQGLIIFVIFRLKEMLTNTDIIIDDYLVYGISVLHSINSYSPYAMWKMCLFEQK